MRTTTLVTTEIVETPAGESGRTTTTTRTRTVTTTTTTTTPGGGGCFGAVAGPPGVCFRPAPTTDDCQRAKGEAETTLASAVDAPTIAAARLARGVALMCLDERPDLAREDIAAAREHEAELNDFSQQALGAIDPADLPEGPREVRDIVLPGSPNANP